MNKTEILAFELLKKRGYKEGDIAYQGSKNPDFVCSDGKRFEIKRIYGKNELLFTERQMKELKGTDIILVFDSEDKELKGEFFWSDRQTDFTIKIIKRSNTKMQITVSDKTYEILKREMKKIGYERINTYAAMVLSSCVMKMEREGRFDDGFG